MTEPVTEDETDAAGGRPPAVASGADPFARTDPPLHAVRVWPHRSMSRRGHRWFLGLLAAGLAIPVLGVWGTPVAWFLSPFLLGALGLAWLALAASMRAGRLVEEVRVWPDLIAVERREPGGRVRRWSANPYWVRLELTDTPTMARYLTLGGGGGRTIELGAFLTPEERVALADDLRDALRRAVAAGAAPG